MGAVLNNGIFKYSKDVKLEAKPQKEFIVEFNPSPLYQALTEDQTVADENEWEIYHEAFRGIAKSKCIRIGNQFQACQYENLCDNAVFNKTERLPKESIECWDASRLSEQKTGKCPL